MAERPYLQAAPDIADTALLPPSGGIGLKPEHYRKILDRSGAAVLPRWVEVHPQNYSGDGGPPHRWLEAIVGVYPLSLHSVGLSLGSAEGCDEEELGRLAALDARYAPAMISDHLSWCRSPDQIYPDLLPIPYTREALDRFEAEIGKVQDRLGRRILVENPSRYLAYRADEMEEPEFIARLIERAGCGLLLDINNVEVSATNLGFSAEAYVDAIDPQWVGELHLAGHAREEHDGGPLLIDDHGSRVTERTWALYARFIARAGALPTLIEWDSNVPAYEVLVEEMQRADRVMAEALAGPPANEERHVLAG